LYFPRPTHLFLSTPNVVRGILDLGLVRFVGRVTTQAAKEQWFHVFLFIPLDPDVVKTVWSFEVFDFYLFLSPRFEMSVLWLKRGMSPCF